MEIFYTLETIHVAIDCLLPHINGGSCIALHGEMGSGKTTLVSKLAAYYGIGEVSSPTYSIINVYPINNDLVIAHMDWYRLESIEHIIDTGATEYISNPQYVTIIEWSERAPELLPKECIHFYLSIVNISTRCLRVERSML